MYQIVLASGSPRRREILNQVGISHTVLVSRAEEVKREGETPEELVKRLSREKASEVAGRVAGPAVIIGADTVVVQDGMVLGKPGTPERAKEMLTRLAGNIHSVYTGVCTVIQNEDGTKEEISFAERSEVELYPMTESQIQEYAQCGEPLDKAGAYAIQGRFAVYIHRIDGNYDNIVGLPVSQLYQRVYEAGIDLYTGRMLSDRLNGYATGRKIIFL